MGYEGSTAVNILALTIALLRLIRYPKAAPSVCRVSAFRAIHHFRHLHFSRL